MKKLTAILLAALICLGVSLTAFADMDGPGIRSVECNVTNPNGARFYYYDYNEETEENILKSKTIPYGAVLMVTAEYDTSWLFENEKALAGKRIGSVEYQDDFGYVLLSDISVADGSFELSQAKRLQHPPTYTVTDKKGIKLYKGPSQVFEEVGTIPEGAEIKLTYLDNGGENGYANSFYYTEYNGMSGWIFHYEGAETRNLIKHLDEYDEYSGKIRIVGKNFRLTDIFSEQTEENNYEFEKITGVIPAGTELTFDRYYESYGDYAEVEYNGVKGYINLFEYGDGQAETVIGINNNIMTFDDCEIYSEFNNRGSKTGEEIPAFTILPAVEKCRYNVNDGDEWEYCTWYLVKYNGKDVWIFDEDGDDADLFYNDVLYNSYYSIKGTSAVLLETPEAGSKTVCALTKDDVLKSLITYYGDDDENTDYYVEVVGGDKAGWIDSEAVEWLEDYEEPYIEEEDTDVPEQSETEAADIKSNEQAAAAGALDAASPASAIERAANSSQKMIIVCVVAAAVIALTAGVTIALIKKKKSAGSNNGTDSENEQ
ncbi:MAG: hypothetical protein IJM10_04910 [Clostridia bacterium]|nr:hypothetical protein [Clostridia bacterium]